MSIVPCNDCGEHIFVHEKTCPHCNSQKISGNSQKTSGDFEERATRRKMTSAAILLGLALSGCGDKGDDTAVDSDTATQPIYGVPDTGQMIDQEPSQESTNNMQKPLHTNERKQ